MDIKIKLGQRIKHIRQNMGISQEQLALKSGLDRTYMTSVENGHRNVSIKNIEKIIRALETNFEEFLKVYNT